MVDLFPAIRLAQSILKRKFLFVDKPLGLRADTLSHKTLLLQKPKADKIHFIKGTLSPVLTGSEDRCS